MCERERGEKEETRAPPGWVFCSLSQYKATGASLLDVYVQIQNVPERLEHSESEKTVDLAKSRIRKLKRRSKLALRHLHSRFLVPARRFP